MTRVLQEAARAEAKFAGFHSSHEGYGVLSEEVAELLDAIRANDKEAVEREAIQCAAVAYRLAQACNLPEFCRRSGFEG